MEASFQVPTTISHYRILSRLGSGGMGEVYLADDFSLNRKVAIKFILPQGAADPSARKRLLKEARAAAQLDHPNICTIHDVDECDDRSFIVMQYIEGETLAARMKRGPLDVEEARSIAIQIAEALAAAHGGGIIHRDLKPQNIMLTPKGQAKLMDFGLAKPAPFGSKELKEAETWSDSSTTQHMVGTVPYMSPEQVRGTGVDTRSDIFSFGIVLYEMLTGRRPFGEESMADTVTQILTRQPPPISDYSSVPVTLQRIVKTCLEKDRKRRYQSVHDLLRDLKSDAPTDSVKTQSVRAALASRMTARWAWALSIAVVALLIFGSIAFLRHQRKPLPSPKPITSLAVLPLVNDSGDPNNDYLSDGVTESIINNLAQLSNLKVMARTTVFRYKGKSIDPQTVGRELGVDAVLTGRLVEKVGRLIIQTDLVNVADGSELWGEKYNRRFKDIFQVQEEIARQISEKLRLRLTGEEQHLLAKQWTADPAAYQLYLKGVYHLNRRAPDDLKKGIEYFQQAAAMDPHLALAFAGVADSYNLLGDYQSLPPKQAYPEAERAALHALELDESLAEAHTALAHARLYEWDWLSAEQHYQRALALKPGYATAHQWYANYLMAVGRTAEALTEIKRALELDPLSLAINSAAGWHFYLARQYNQAIEQQQHTLDLDSSFNPAHAILGLAWAQKGEYAKAISEFETAVSRAAGNPDYSAELGRIYALSGNRPKAQAILEELLRLSRQHYVSPYSIARVYAALGDNNQALDWLNKAVQERNSELIFVRVEPDFTSLHADPRFAELIRQMGFPSH